MGKHIIHAIGFIILFMIVAVIGVIIHEAGHGMAADWQDGEFEYIAVNPGYVVYPFDRIDSVESAGPVIAWARFKPGSNWKENEYGWVDLAGGLSTSLVAFLALRALYLFKPRRLGKLILIAFACLFFIDLPRYSSVSLIGSYARLEDPGTGKVIECNGALEPSNHPEGYNAPPSIKTPELHFVQITCDKGTSAIHFRLEGSQWAKPCNTDYCFPVFYRMENHLGSTWAVAEYSWVNDNAQHFVDYLDNAQLGEYEITSAWTVYNGLRGMIFWGVTYPEPLVGAARIGINPAYYLGMVYFLVLFQAFMLLRYIRKSSNA